jgi:hypothetical protein
VVADYSETSNILERKFIKRPGLQQNYIHAYQSNTKILFLDNFCSFSYTHFLYCALIYMILITRLIAIFTHTVCFGIEMEMEISNISS